MCFIYPIESQNLFGMMNTSPLTLHPPIQEPKSTSSTLMKWSATGLDLSTMYHLTNSRNLDFSRSNTSSVKWQVSYPRILVKSNSDELWTSPKSSLELLSNKVLMPGKWVYFISLLWTIYIYLCILQFLYSGSSNSEYKELLVLHSYFIFFMDFVCYLFCFIHLFIPLHQYKYLGLVM